MRVEYPDSITCGNYEAAIILVEAHTINFFAVVSSVHFIRNIINKK